MFDYIWTVKLIKVCELDRLIKNMRMTEEDVILHIPPAAEWRSGSDIVVSTFEILTERIQPFRLSSISQLGFVRVTKQHDCKCRGWLKKSTLSML